MKAGSVSVFTTLFNHERYVGEALASAVAQTRPPDEIVVIDDASTDRSVEVVKRLDHPALRLIEQPRNLGGATTMLGLAACRGEFVAILNSDDAWEPGKLALQLAYLDAHPRCGAVFTRVTLVDEEGRRWAPGEHPLEPLLQARNRSRCEWLRHFFEQGNALCASSAVVRRACIDQLGPLDGRYVQLQDLEMWTRVAVAGFELHVLDAPLTRYRMMRRHANMSTTSWPTRARQTYEHALLLRHLWRLRSVELQQMFPEGPVPDDDRLVCWWLGRIAGTRPGLHHQQFAVDSMFEFARHPEAVAIAAERFGFSHRDYRDFLARNPLGAAEKAPWRRFKFLLASRLRPGALRWLRRSARRIASLDGED